MYPQIEGMMSAEDAADHLVFHATNIAAAIKRKDNCFFPNRKTSVLAVLKLLEQYVQEENGAAPVSTASAAPEAPLVDRIVLNNDGKNPSGYTADAARSGDPGIYDEIRAGVYQGTKCVADILIGLTPAGEPRVMVTVDGKGDDGPQIAVFPLRSAENAVSLDQQ